MKKYSISEILSLIIGIVLIVIVWKNSHWSVALTLSFLCLKATLEDLLKKLAK